MLSLIISPLSCYHLHNLFHTVLPAATDCTDQLYKAKLQHNCEYLQSDYQPIVEFRYFISIYFYFIEYKSLCCLLKLAGQQSRQSSQLNIYNRLVASQNWYNWPGQVLMFPGFLRPRSGQFKTRKISNLITSDFSDATRLRSQDKPVCLNVSETFYLIMAQQW